MKSFSPVLLGLSLLLLLNSTILAKDLPDYDAAASHGVARRAPLPPAAQDPDLIRPGSKMHTDDRMGVPTFLWAGKRGLAGGGSSAGKVSLLPEQAARRHLAAYAPLYRLDGSDVQGAGVKSIHNTGRGAVIVAFHRKVDGIEVFREEIKMVMTQKLDLVAISGHVSGTASASRSGRKPFTEEPAAAIAVAMFDLTGIEIDPLDLESSGRQPGGYELFDLGAQLQSSLDVEMIQPARTKKVFFHLPGGLEPAYYLELNVGERTGQESDYYSYVISAADSQLLFRHNLTASDAVTYRVWADSTDLMLPFDGPQGTTGSPHPTGLTDGFQAPFVAPNLVTLQAGPISTLDPWLPPGATETVGNNVDAFADVTSPDGLTAGDFRATATGTNTFDRTYNTSLSPSSSAGQRMASITQLFYTINFLHDWFYDSGFNEVSGNAQSFNYGRGGLENDSMRAEAQDFSGRNNANMSTPSDGGRPRMQMFVFDGIGRRSFTVNSPAAIAGDYAVGTAQFGPATFNVTGAVILVDDGSIAGTGGTTTDACQTPFSNFAAVSGKIALLDRGGGCTFALKVKNAQLNGAIGAVIANNTTGILNMSGTDGTITIPSLLIAQADGNAVKAQLGSGVNATLLRQAATDRDGTIDNQIVAHEWGHYISNRLVGNSNGLSNLQGGGMGEGWGDFHAQLLTVRPEDALVASNADFSGVYSAANYVRSGGSNGNQGNQGYYFGIRRVPYSTDFSKNPLTFKHISNGIPLPTTAPIAFGADGSNNAEVHNAGEVWATMLWECYAALLRDTARLTFDQARDRMLDYLVAAYKMTPNAPTFLEARDALLAAAFANDQADFVLFSQAFARRGAGIRSVAPDRHASGNLGVVESFVAGNDLTFAGVTLDDDITYCDNDGILDSGETGRLTITMRNSGNGALSATTATITSTNPAVTFPGGDQISLPASQPYGATTGSVAVSLAGTTTIQQMDFDISVEDPGFAIPGPVTATSIHRGNYDDVPNQSATDDVESSSPRWTIASNPTLPPIDPWRRLEITGADHRWFGPDPGGLSDEYLISPALNVASTGTFSFTFRHRYSFEFQASPLINYDGGVIEISTDGGGSWTDIGASASPGYTGTLDAGNAMGPKAAYTGVSPSYPAFGTVTVNLGTTYLGQTVRVRFRLGADGGVGAPGWEIDDIVFNNITNLPFNVLVNDRALCIDSDTDGFSDITDCAPFNAAVWAAPGQALDLEVTGSATAALSWSAPSDPGGTSLVYDVLRSETGSSFASAICLETNGSDLVATDPAIPGGIFYYLIRTENACGSNLGTDSSGVARSGVSCP